MKVISQIQYSLFDYFYSLYYHVLPLGQVGASVKWKLSVEFIIKSARGHGTEGWPSNPGPLATGDRHFLRHAFREHWRPVVCKKDAGEVPPRCRKGEEEDVPGGLPPATSTLLFLCGLGGRASGGGGDGYPEKDIHSPSHQVAAAELKDVWIRQE